MRSELEFLKKALNRSVGSDSPFSCYHVYDGLIYAQNEKMQAVAPFIFGSNFSAPGSELETALARMTTEPTVSLANGMISLKAGRIRAEVPVVVTTPPPVYDRDVVWTDLPANFLSALKIAAEFVIGPQEGWANAIRLMGGRMTVINNRCGVDVAVPGLLCSPSLLTKDVAEFILAQDPPDRYASKPGIAFMFQWDDGRTLQAQLVDSAMPDRVDQIFASAGQVAPVEITEEWRAAYADADAMAESRVEVRADGLHVDRGTSKITLDVATPIAEVHASLWETKVIGPMVEVATHWNPEAYPKAALFKGPGLYGVVTGLKQ